MKKIIIAILLLVVAIFSVRVGSTFAFETPNSNLESRINAKVDAAITDESVYAVVRIVYDDGNENIRIIGVNEYEGCDYYEEFDHHASDDELAKCEYTWLMENYFKTVEA